jgi:NADH:ubiquinone oxidoreductase subunit
MNIGTRLFTYLHGRLVGTDEVGNRYFEDKRAALPGHRVRRWVAYAGAVEASSIPPEWYGWIHYTIDAPLPENRRRYWQKEHLANVTGTPASYRPAGHDYSGGHRAAATGDYQAWTPED